MAAASRAPSEGRTDRGHPSPAWAMMVDYVAAYASGGGTPPTDATRRLQAAQPGNRRTPTRQSRPRGFNAQSGVQTESTTDSGGGQNIGWLANATGPATTGWNFGASAATQFVARVASGARVASAV